MLSGSARRTQTFVCRDCGSTYWPGIRRGRRWVAIHRWAPLQAPCETLTDKRVAHEAGRAS